jgi:DNA-binding PadR family transcriptional regulator
MPESMNRGALTEAVFYILLAVVKPTHGYGIMKFIRDLTQDRVIIGSGTLYGALGKLLENGWIEIGDDPGNDKKLYCLTRNGRKTLSGELERLKELVAHGEVVMGGFC